MKTTSLLTIVLVIVASSISNVGADLPLPYIGEANTVDVAFVIRNTGSGVAIQGDATNMGNVANYGGIFMAGGKSGVGVYGSASNTDVAENYGGYFLASGVLGRGVYSRASGSAGRGVYGEASAIGDYSNYGGYFKATGDKGTGVRGEATATGMIQNCGGHFTSAGENGKGVYGQCTGNHGFGVYGEGTVGLHGVSKLIAVEGFATETGDHINYGGYFEAAGDRGTGVIGIASSKAIGDPDLPDQPEYCGGAFSAYGLGGIGIFATGGRFAAQFDGRVEVNGPITSSGTYATPSIRLRNELSGEEWRITSFDDGKLLFWNLTNMANQMAILQNGNVGIGTTEPQGKLDVAGSIYQRGSELHADYVFEPGYQLESIDKHSELMWTQRHLPAIPKVQTDENGQEIVEVGAHRKGIVEELEKAHIYIEQLNGRINALEEKLATLEAKHSVSE